ncbi:hypothetical protein KC19_12G128100 [Ceratodon purpureus]|uniref:Late embryogenesis abundant protein LEA-2 subgroup domain-containing protein n=1 Tax=Ceratodon purpureus TaxID=3225 RepID=A0A8T0G783_CERPU|nr:hypothetical protein KC19_12G128100 [Ceratodon purpureus]
MVQKQGFYKMELSDPSNGTVEEDGLKTQVVKPAYKRRKWGLCCGVCFVVILALGIVAIALSQTIFKFRDPKIALNNVKVQNVSMNLDLASLSTLLSVSVSADVQVDNPNYYDFRYNNSTMVLAYHGSQVGVVELGGGTIRSRKIVDLPAVITVEALKLVLNGLQDLTSGVASLTLNAVIPGRVNLARIYKRHVTAILNCDIDVFIGNQTLKQNTCKQTIKL